MLRAAVRGALLVVLRLVRGGKGRVRARRNRGAWFVTRWVGFWLRGCGISADDKEDGLCAL